MYTQEISKNLVEYLYYSILCVKIYTYKEKKGLAIYTSNLNNDWRLPSYFLYFSNFLP